jgi:tetratricopeptide (TPR) repeat protein
MMCAKIDAIHKIQYRLTGLIFISILSTLLCGCLDFFEKDPNYYVNEGNNLSIEGRYDEAIEAYEKAIKINPEYSEAWNLKGEALSKSGNPREAIKCFDVALAIDPEYAEAWNNKGLRSRDLGYIDEAVNCFDNATDFNPSYAEAWYNKGETFSAQGSALSSYRYDEVVTYYSKAQESYDKAIGLNSSYTDAIDSLNDVLDLIEELKKIKKEQEEKQRRDEEERSSLIRRCGPCPPGWNGPNANCECWKWV